MTTLNQSSLDINTTETNATLSLSLANNENDVIPLPATLTNALLNFNYLLDGEPVESDVTGTLTVTAQYKEGREIPIAEVDLATTSGNVGVMGKYTQLNVSLASLTGADTVIIYVDQNTNIV